MADKLFPDRLMCLIARLIRTLARYSLVQVALNASIYCTIPYCYLHTLVCFLCRVKIDVMSSDTGECRFLRTKRSASTTSFGSQSCFYPTNKDNLVLCHLAHPSRLPVATIKSQRSARWIDLRARGCRPQKKRLDHAVDTAGS